MKQKKTPSFPEWKQDLRHIQLKMYAFFHKSRSTPYALIPRQGKKKTGKGPAVRLAVTLGALALVTVLAMIPPLRPHYSETERRELTSFPKFTVASALDGSYFSGISTWFADTFPMRDTFLSIQNHVESLYGARTTQIVGQVTQGDAIPEVINNRIEDDEEELPTEEETPEEDTPAEETPAEETPTEETLGEDTPAEETPAEETPGEDTPAEETPAEETPEEETPVEEPPPEEEDEDLAIPELGDDAVVEKLSSVLCIDNAAYEYYNFVKDYADHYTSVINRAAEQLDGKARVFSLIVPNSMGICVPDDVRETTGSSDQKSAIEYMSSNLDERVHVVGVYNTLLKHYLDGEYLYFRTDHHWTQMGAYRAYEKFARAAGFTPTPLDSFVPHEYEGFLGSFYNSTKSDALAETPDTVYAYEPPSTNTIHITNTDMADWKFVVIGNVDKASAGNKYGTFIGGDNPYSYIENPNKDDGSAIMLIKESYGNCFAPLLVENYQYVYIVDYRYISKVDDRHLAQLCEDLGVQDVLFLNTISTTRASNLIDRLDSFVGE